MSVEFGGWFADAKSKASDATEKAKTSFMEKKANACKGKVTSEVHKKIVNMAKANKADFVTTAQLEFLKSQTKQFGCQDNLDMAYDKLIGLAKATEDGRILIKDVNQDLADMHIGAAFGVHFMAHGHMVSFQTA